MSLAMSAAPLIEGQRCLLCKQGTLRKAKSMLGLGSQFLKCDVCRIEYHPAGARYAMRNMQKTNQYLRYQDEPLTAEEIARIASGGVSDAQLAEIAKQAEADRKYAESVRQQQENERQQRLARESTPGTVECYLVAFRRIIGQVEGQESASLSFKTGSSSEIKTSLAQIRQMQKELRQLKKEIAQTIKIKKLEVTQRGYTVARAQALKNLASLNYDPLTKMIDSALVQLDGLKLKIENPSIERDAPTQDKPVSAAKPESKKEVGGAGSVDEAGLKQALDELNTMIGLQPIKSDVTELVNFLTVQQLRKIRGMAAVPVSLHVVFYGNPGTGKTSVARILAKIYKALGLLTIGQLVETDRAGLVAGYVGQTAIKVNQVVEQALGGILFIDEAYSLTQDNENDYGKEAIDTLLKRMEDHRDNLAVIVAGYTEKMDKFLTSNPGLRSRFNRFWLFADYSPSELVTIFESLCTTSEMHSSETAKQKVLDLFTRAYQSRDTAFGNARLARNIFESAIGNQANRIVSAGDTSTAVLETIEAADIPESRANLGGQP
jgi:Cdc6-like AAA superfamily ATPase